MKLAVIILACAATVLGNNVSPAAVLDDTNFQLERYTKDKETINTASDLLKKRLYVEDAYHTNDVDVQYLMIVNAVNSLIEVSNDEKSYAENFYETVNNAILETSESPLKVADKLTAQLVQTQSKIAAISDLIAEKQSTVCQEPISYACDVIIHIAVKTSRDSLLKLQAHHIGSVAKEAESYLNSYYEEFADVAKMKNAPAYLVNGINRLRTLVMLGVRTRKEGKPIPPVGNRRFSSIYVYEG